MLGLALATNTAADAEFNSHVVKEVAAFVLLLLLLLLFVVIVLRLLLPLFLSLDGNRSARQTT